MKYILILPLIISGLFAQKITKTVTVNYTRAYCGGAKPPAELLEQLNTPKPLANCKLILKSADGKKIYKVKTDANGKFTKKFAQFKYNVFLASNSKSKAELPFNKQCKKLLEKQLGELDLSNGNEITIKLPCDPCDPDMKRRQ